MPAEAAAGTPSVTTTARLTITRVTYSISHPNPTTGTKFALTGAPRLGTSLTFQRKARLMRTGGKEGPLILVVCDVRFYREGVADALSADGAHAIACAHSEVVETRSRLDDPVDVALVDLSGSDCLQTLEHL